MTVHDWTRVDAGLFHDFHQSWAVALSSSLNAGRLPPDYFALVERNIREAIPDVLTRKLAAASDRIAEPAAPYVSEVAVATRTPRTWLTQRIELDSYARKASRIAVRHRHGDVLSEIVLDIAEAFLAS